MIELKSVEKEYGINGHSASSKWYNNYFGER